MSFISLRCFQENNLSVPVYVKQSCWTKMVVVHQKGIINLVILLKLLALQASGGWNNCVNSY